LRHSLNQPVDGIGFPLDVNDAASTGTSQLGGGVEPAASGAKADDVEGTKTHTVEISHGQ
jgi:hypothetical protein